MSETHWKTMMDNTYLGVCDFNTGEYKNLKIVSVKKEKIPPRNEERPVIYFGNGIKPLVCNATNGKMIQKLLKTPIVEKWAGHTITLYADMSVSAPGQKRGEVPNGGIRVLNQLPTPQKKHICPNCGKEVTGVKINGVEYSAEQIIKSSGGWCYPCYAEKMKQEKEKEEKREN